MANLKLLLALHQYADAQQLNVVFGPANQNGIDIVTWTSDGARVFNDAVSLDADIVLIDPTISAFDPNDIQRLYFNAPKPIVTIGAIPPQTDWGSKLAEIGAKAFVNLPLSEEKARQLVGMAHKAVQEALRERASPGYIPQVSSQVAQVIAAHGWEKSMVAVWGAKGGVGKSTIAENLAAILGVIANRNTVLVDANMAGGNVHIHLGIRDPQTAKNIDALARRYELNVEMKKNRDSGNVGMLAAHPLLSPLEIKGLLFPFAGNLSVLVGIPRQHMAGGKHFQGEEGQDFMRELLTMLKNMADFVVLDLGQDTNAPVHLEALSQVNYVFVVINSDAASVRATGEVMDTLFGHVHLDKQKFRLVVNRFNEEHGIHRKDIVQALQMSEVGVVPDGGPKVTASLNRGRPLVLDSRGEVARSLVAVASTLYPPITQIWAQRGRLAGEKKPGFGQQLKDLVFGPS